MSSSCHWKIRLSLFIRTVLFISCIFILLPSNSTDVQPTQTVNELVMLPFDALESKLSVTNGSIAFFFLSGARVITGIAACSVQSAAKHHPDTPVLAFIQPWMKTPLAWATYVNIEIVELNETKLLANTVLYDWYKGGQVERSQLRDYHMGDALRLAYLWKYGGMYLDTDTIVLRKMIGNVRNCLAYENVERSAIDGAVMIFDKAHPFIYLAMNKFVDEFHDMWGYQGPNLMLRTYEVYETLEMQGFDQVRVLNVSSFYPISWKNLEIRKMYQAKHVDWTLDRIGDSFAVHLWNKASKRFNIEKHSALDQLFRIHCSANILIS